jgi:D-methionine transport system permease protein
MISSRFNLGAALSLAFGETFFMVSVSLLISVIIGTLLGYLLYSSSNRYLSKRIWTNRVTGFLINSIRSMPFIILLVVLLPLSGLIVRTQIGPVAVIVPLSISSTAFFSRLSESAFNGVDKGVVEYAVSSGASGARVFMTVLLPEASSSLISAITVNAIALLGSSAMAGTIGGGGVGDLAIRYGYQRFQTNIMLICVAVLLVLVQALQLTGDYFSRRANKK